MRQLVLCSVLFAIVLSNSCKADDSFLERFALAEDRDAVLKELIPGTQEYYYFHCLHHQNLQQYDRVESLLKKWIARYKRGGLINEIRYRQAVLTYDRNPQKSLEFIRAQCGLLFNHQRDTPNAEPDLPESLNQNLISRERLLKQAYAELEDGTFLDRRPSG